MIIPDSNIFIDFWRHPTKEIEHTFENEDIVLCGVVRAELLQGAVSVKNFNQIVEGLDSFQEVNLETEDYVGVRYQRGKLCVNLTYMIL